jgi:hypothetical protein
MLLVNRSSLLIAKVAIFVPFYLVLNFGFLGLILKLFRLSARPAIGLDIDLI